MGGQERKAGEKESQESSIIRNVNAESFNILATKKWQGYC